MNKPTVYLVLFLLLLHQVSSGSGSKVTSQIFEDLILETNTSRVIEGGSHNFTGGLFLDGNSSLTLKNTEITFEKNDDAEYRISGDSILTAINCSIVWESPQSIQVSGNASVELNNVELYSAYEVSNRTYFIAGIGLSDTAKISVDDSKIGFIRLSDNAECIVRGSHLGDFGTQSRVEAELSDCTIEQLFLVYEQSRVQINQSLIGKHERFSQSQLVKAGDTRYEFKMINSTIQNPPNIYITDGKLEAKDTKLDIVSIDGDSAIEATDTHICYLRLTGYSWAFIEDSEIEYLSGWEGDFNIQLTNTTHSSISTHGTQGLNLKTNGTKTKYLTLDGYQSNTPTNVEFHETEIGDLYLTMYSPQQIQCDKVTLGNLTFESGWGHELPITITGTIDFKPDATLIQRTKEGYTLIRRIYLVEATIDNQPASNTQLTIKLDNNTKTITTNQEGKAILPVTYLRQFTLINNPQPGGPYIINRDNLTKPVTIIMNNQNYTINLLSDTPVRLSATSNTTSERWEPDWSQHTPAAVILTIIAIIVYLYNTRRRESENRQIQ